MNTEKLQRILEKALGLQELYVTSMGNHYEVIAIDVCFDEMSYLEKQRLIYSPLMEYIQRNEIHALSIRAFTPNEWACDKRLMSL
ncbi:toluene transport system [Candidatus Photodesmus blepharus]|uniref:Toluene transport system n=1 Tax=Candidatus Photodesmus blepharonis TaxID=1179155 RepID=A0A084CM36_9GAMM|nr:BolA family protein [Candidatus Photodesmus blepharus]KEY90865.1 toluene transport system [Candidatus Photodesmus blepharus]